MFVKNKKTGLPNYETFPKPPKNKVFKEFFTLLDDIEKYDDLEILDARDNLISSFVVKLNELKGNRFVNNSFEKISTKK